MNTTGMNNENAKAHTFTSRPMPKHKKSFFCVKNQCTIAIIVFDRAIVVPTVIAPTIRIVLHQTFFCMLLFYMCVCFGFQK